MPYAAQTDLVPARLTLGDLTELTSDTDAAGPDPVVVGTALTNASAKVDGYCGQRYQIPLQPSIMVTEIVCDLAIYDLASRRRETKPTETMAERYQQAMSLLRDIASGKASLDQPPANTTPQGSSADVTLSPRRQTFDDCNLRGFC